MPDLQAVKLRMETDPFLVEFAKSVDPVDVLRIQNTFDDDKLFVISNPFAPGGANWAVVRKGSPDVELQMDKDAKVIYLGWNFIIRNPIPREAHIGVPVEVFIEILDCIDGWKKGRSKAARAVTRKQEMKDVDAGLKEKENKEWHEECTLPTIELLKDANRSVG